MNPLAAYLLSVLKREKADNTRTYSNHEWALTELGYWCLPRPAGYPRERMPPCKISTECVLVDTFLTYSPPTDYGGIKCEGFEVAVDVYANPDVANQ